MPGYLEKKKVLQEIKSWWRYAMMADGEPALNSTIKALPPADVVEHSKIDCAIDKIMELSIDICYTNAAFDYGVKMVETEKVLEILKKL